ncbi:MAG TPA: hypothetical protein VK969_11480 [Acidimicrobiia bacterium]|nr:hypothetical protein [Acidimicrobiia bacterium]
MMVRALPDTTLRPLAGWLGIVVLAELVLLRSGTRTLIHIPGLGDFETTIGLVSEVGRFAYYLSVVLVIVVLGYIVHAGWSARTRTGSVVGGLVAMFLLAAFLGRVGVIPVSAVGWVSLAVIFGLLLATGAGARSVPVALFVAAWAFASWSVLGQELGGGISGRAVDVATVAAEGLLLVALASTPLLASGRIPRAAIVAGSAVFVLVTAGFQAGGATLSILTLWNLGVPGWFPPVTYGLAFGGLTVALWSSLAARNSVTACGLVLMVGSGVGPISTYQTSLAVVAVVFLGVEIAVSNGKRFRQPNHDQREQPPTNRSPEPVQPGALGSAHVLDRP